MVNEPDEVRTESEEEEGGGPVKTFLEHLEDLRWTLVKTIVAVVLAMLVCLVAGKHLVAFLTWPLRHAQSERPDTNHVSVVLGTNIVGKLSLKELGALGTNSVGSLKMVPVKDGSNYVFALQPLASSTEERSRTLVTLKGYSPLSGILVAMKLALYGGLVLAAPFVFLFIGQFVLPALKVTEKRILFRVVSFGSVLFFVGVGFCYLVVTSVALNATVQFSQWMGFGADEWRAEDYISFVCKFMLGMGVGFQLPVVILTLVKIGLLDYEKLSRLRMYAVVANLVIAAVATPSGDPVTMFLMALPLQFLYEVSALIAWYWDRRDKRRSAEAGMAANGSKQAN